jgi:hypothetical protein
MGTAFLWTLSLSLWLWRAYMLEFEGHNTFIEIWIVSLLFHITNVISIVIVIVEVKSHCNKDKDS